MTIHIVTDSSVRFLDLENNHHDLINLVPTTVRFEDQAVEDRPDLLLGEVRSQFEADPGKAYADPPSVEQLVSVYSRLQDETDEIVSIHTSAGINATYRNAVRASEGFRGRCDIQVIDSTSLSAGLGMLASRAAAAAEAGSSLEDIVRVVRGIIPRLYVVFFLDDLAYLERNGLVSRSQAILGNMLNIFPFLTVEHGRLIPMEKVRTRIRAQEKLIEFVTEFSDIEHLGILHSTTEPDEEALSVAERLEALYPDTPISYVNYGPALATYVGLNSLGLVVLESEEEAL
ncbi:MAG: DegV family protein [Anaerolineae bacterium]|nr:MAG: DegV family protein [Anaerolineae bacterium]